MLASVTLTKNILSGVTTIQSSDSTDLVAAIAANPTPDNKAMREDTIYYRVLAEFQREDYDDAEKDLRKAIWYLERELKRMSK